MLYNNTTEVLRVYPQQNHLWLALDTEFMAEASNFNGQPITDPWGRKLPNPLIPVRCGTVDDEIVAWTTQTTVDGTPFLLRIIND